MAISRQCPSGAMLCQEYSATNKDLLTSVKYSDPSPGRINEFIRLDERNSEFGGPCKDRFG